MAILDHLSRTVRTRSPALSRPLVLAGVAVLSLASIASIATAASAGASPVARPPSISLFGGSATFHVGGHTWSLSIFAFSGSAGIDLSTTHEVDTWNFFSVPASDLKVNAKTGRATFSAHNSLAPVAFANLTFTATSRHKASCRRGSEIIFDGRLSGSFTLVANHKGLKFKSARVTFRGSSVGVDHQCLPPSGGGATPCIAGVWNVGQTTSALGSTPGLPGRQPFFVNVIKTGVLSAPKNASVSYDVFGSGPKPVFNTKRKSLSVKGTKVVKGSAVLVPTGPHTSHTAKCTIGRKHYKSNDTSYFGSFTSPRGGQFQARSIVGGKLTVQRSGFAFFDIITFKAA